MTREAPQRAGRPVRAGVRLSVRVCSLPLAALALTLTGCGISDSGPAHAGAPARGERAGTADRTLRITLVAPHGSWAVIRSAPAHAGPQQALDALLAGPTASERARGITTALPQGSHRVRAVAAPGTVDLYLPWLVSELPRAAVNQLVCTAAAAPGVPGGKRPPDVVVRVHESGLSGEPWRVRCDETGSTAPLGTNDP
ncbi:GerMN domain-containing protein [Streptomyces sp. AN091965]|uniref:GerMN domain-containing protein n=1 Tax=Streptomyces sp. AN091965 TaxID=2927803 RepID=UPI001F6247BB|nr:GerMN domain-containing protein [Streptomyces sp. AN091965]MCI3935525.1 GerMN domain-containing protein [Streptomyces sp. AN091965]